MTERNHHQASSLSGHVNGRRESLQSSPSLPKRLDGSFYTPSLVQLLTSEIQNQLQRIIYNRPWTSPKKPK